MGVVVLLRAAAVANVRKHLGRASVDAASMMRAGFLGTVAKWAVLILAFLAALDQLGVARAFITTLLQGFVAMLAIAGGLAFGLGGKSAAKDLFAKFEEEMKSGR